MIAFCYLLGIDEHFLIKYLKFNQNLNFKIHEMTRYWKWISERWWMSLVAIIAFYWLLPYFTSYIAVVLVSTIYFLVSFYYKIIQRKIYEGALDFFIYSINIFLLGVGCLRIMKGYF